MLAMYALRDHPKITMGDDLGFHTGQIGMPPPLKVHNMYGFCILIRTFMYFKYII